MISPFDPIKLGSITLKNRFIRSATHDYFGSPDGVISEREIEIVTQLAKNKVGGIITALMSVSKNGICEINQNRIDDNKFIKQLKNMCQAVHKFDSKLIVQICHGGYKSLPSDEMPCPLGPSTVLLKEGLYSRALVTHEIEEIVEEFANAAVRSQAAGADGVQIHAAHGYLLSQFLSPYENIRQDIYGGSAENRFRIVDQIIERIHSVCGNDFPILIKFNTNLVRGNNEITGDNKLYLDDLVLWINYLTKLNVSAVELSGTGFSQFSKLSGPYFLDLALEIRKKTQMPLILVGGIKTLDDIHAILDCGIECISMSRSFISNPDLIIDFESGKKHSSCISCNQCFSLPLTNNKRCIFDNKNCPPNE